MTAFPRWFLFPADNPHAEAGQDDGGRNQYCHLGRQETHILGRKEEYGNHAYGQAYPSSNQGMLLDEILDLRQTLLLDIIRRAGW